MKKILRVLTILAMALGLSLSPVPGWALPILDFGTGSAGVGGLLTLLGGPNATVAGVPIDNLIVTGAPVAGVYDLSGAFVSASSVGGTSAVIDFDTRTATNFITITGGVPGLGIASTTLLSGTFSSFTITQPFTNILCISGLGVDTKDPGLLTALGIDPTLPFIFFGFTINANFDPITGTGNAYSTDFVNTGVPEPATMLLLGSGLIGVGIIVRRKYKK